MLNYSKGSKFNCESHIILIIIKSLMNSAISTALLFVGRMGSMNMDYVPGKLLSLISNSLPSIKKLY